MLLEEFINLIIVFKFCFNIMQIVKQNIWKNLKKWTNKDKLPN